MAIAFAQVARAQITKVNLRADGLTCSMCSNAINKALRTLDFVEDVKADLKTYSFSISFKPGSSIDFDQIKDKVEDAGFFVSSFSAFITFNHVQIKAKEPVKLGEKTFWFTNTEEQTLDGVKELKVLNKGFVSSKEFKKIRAANPAPGNYLVHI
ncbi:heavy-metal-associated domain-containing protein [Spirosoma gilvum]